jgi:hypothetical protein
VVAAVKPVIALVNIPVPVPSVVLVDKAMVGFAVVLQQTPRAVTVAPPSATTLPPPDAVVIVTDDSDAVVTVGNAVDVLVVVKLISLPYAVPALLVA